jgi:hypothetical protein
VKTVECWNVVSNHPAFKNFAAFLLRAKAFYEQGTFGTTVPDFNWLNTLFCCCS